MARLEVLKTYKLFIDGKFPRSESGRVSPYKNAKGKLIAQVCKGSRKDFKAATVAARNAQPAWSARTPYNRSQILYRIAEMLESRSTQFIEEMTEQGLTKKAAEKELQVSVDRLVHYAGWCDKYSAVFSSVNPVSSSHLNFSQPEPMGIVAVFAAEKFPLTGLVSMMAPIIAGGNTCMIFASEKFPLTALSFGEVLATSDLPAGVVNIISAERAELAGPAADHRDINALVVADVTVAERKELETACAHNLKRFFKWDLDWSQPESQNPYLILDLQEIKTTWHPLENTGGSGTKY
jgi:acyl-CoA reductase-like NAD-dependent aldehyde dehydrogenase